MTEAVMRILGIDPGTRYVGFGVLEQRGFVLRWLASGCIAGGTGEVPERLVRIHRGLQDVIGIYRPGAAVIETAFTGVNPRTAIAIGEGRGVAVLSAAECGLSVRGYEPALVKKAVAGSGRAGKEQVRSMVRILLGLSESPATDHESDALALAITHAMHCRLAPERGRFVPALNAAGRGPLPEHIARQLPPGRPVRRRGRGGR